MPSVRVGQTAIAYEVRRTAMISERRITVTPGSVEVLALTTDEDADIEGFLGRKRQWLFDTVREMQETVANRPAVPRFMTGSKIPFRGRQAGLTVRRHDGAHVEIGYRSGFLIDLPSWVRPDDVETVAANELKLWLKRRVRRDVAEISASYAKRFGLKPRGIRVGEMKTGWGACGPAGGILINWMLVFAPKSVLEYVVVHELAHLKERSHDDKFWSLLRNLMPSYSGPKAWLDAHEGSLDASFLRR